MDVVPLVLNLIVKRLSPDPINMSAPAKRKCPHCGLLLSKRQVSRHLEKCHRLLLATPNPSQPSSSGLSSGSDFHANGTINGGNSGIPTTSGILSGTRSSAVDIQDASPVDVQDATL